MKILLIGNPNVGKSALFNRLTGANVIISNYPGTTVEFTEGILRIEETKATVIDVPGTYSLDPASKAEEIAVKILQDASDEDVIVNVVDATNLERNLNLTLQLLKLKKPMMVALNFWDETRHRGVIIDVQKLEELLGIPCVPLVAITGSGIKTLVENISKARISGYEYDEQERWRETGKIVESVQILKHRHHTFLDRLGEVSVHPFGGILIAAVVLITMFEVIRFIGEGLIKYISAPFFSNIWTPVLLKLSALLGSKGFFHDILIGRLIDGKIDFTQSFGLLTTGLYVEFNSILPYVLAFYLVLAFLEDSGYLPRLAVLSDNIMHKLGLHGMGIIPMILGLGCNVPAAISARIMESDRERFIVITLTAIAVPCMAQIAMIAGLAGAYGAQAFLPIFLTLFIVWLVIGLILNKTIKGESPEILIDIPPYRIPYFKGLLKKTWMRIAWFLREAVPWVLFGVLLANILYNLGIIAFIGKIASPVVTGVLGLPPEAVGGLVIGFLRKDVAVGMLAPLHLSLSQLVVASVVLTMYFPCVAAFSVMIRELGIVKMLKASAIMILSALAAGGILNFLFRILG